MLARRLPISGLLLCALFALLTGWSAAAEVLSGPAGFVSTVQIEGLGKGTAPLDGTWEFHTGDDAAWAAPGFDDTLWDRLTGDKPWGLQGYESYEGFAWYRMHLKLEPARGTAGQFALLIPAIDDVYEVYWNGQRMGGLGRMPPDWTAYTGVQSKIYDLGTAREGVLAIRVWKLPLFSIDDGRTGGFEAAPLVGSPEGIARARAELDYRWLQGRQFQFGLTSLYALVMLLSAVAWLRDRREWLLFWTSALSQTLVASLLLNGLRLQIPLAVQVCLTQIEIGVREVSLWFLLLWLLRLQRNRKLLVMVRKAALISMTASLLDGVLIFFYPGLLTARQTQIVDAVLTPAMVFFELLPLVLVAYALVNRQRLDSARWVVAVVAFASGVTHFLQNVTAQGLRFTHWDFADRIARPLFTLGGNPFNVLLLLQTALFFSILYAVIRTFLDHRRRSSVLEKEYESARELQRVLVPASMPVVPGFTLTSAYVPAQQVGGDFFQVIPLENGATLVVLGDVSGKGLMAAMSVSLIVGALRALAEEHPAPGELMTLLNRRLCGRLQGGFATCVILRLAANSECTLASAGHPAPFLNGREIELPGALPLGIAPMVEYAESRVRLEIGDHFSLYTDGLLEARNPSGELFSFGRLGMLFATRPSAAQATQAAVNFGQDDDITVLTLTRLAANEEKLTLEPVGMPA